MPTRISSFHMKLTNPQFNKKRKTPGEEHTFLEIPPPPHPRSPVPPFPSANYDQGLKFCMNLQMVFFFFFFYAVVQKTHQTVGLCCSLTMCRISVYVLPPSPPPFGFGFLRRFPPLSCCWITVWNTVQLRVRIEKYL